jgi:hypothetical protein
MAAGGRTRAQAYQHDLVTEQISFASCIRRARVESRPGPLGHQWRKVAPAIIGRVK